MKYLWLYKFFFFSRYSNMALAWRNYVALALKNFGYSHMCTILFHALKDNLELEFVTLYTYRIFIQARYVQLWLPARFIWQILLKNCANTLYSQKNWLQKRWCYYHSTEHVHVSLPDCLLLFKNSFFFTFLERFETEDGTQLYV